MQIYEEKSAEFIDFATKLACFGENTGADWENFRDYMSIILIIIF